MVFSEPDYVITALDCTTVYRAHMLSQIAKIIRLKSIWYQTDTFIQGSLPIRILHKWMHNTTMFIFMGYLTYWYCKGKRWKTGVPLYTFIWTYTFIIIFTLCHRVLLFRTVLLLNIFYQLWATLHTCIYFSCTIIWQLSISIGQICRSLPVAASNPCSSTSSPMKASDMIGMEIWDNSGS